MAEPSSRAQAAFKDGLSAVERGNVAAALEHFHRACGMEPEIPAYQVYRAWTTYQLAASGGDSFADLKQSCRRVIIDVLETSPNFDIGYVLLGSILLAEKRRDRAAQAFQRALRVNPNNAGAQMGLKNCGGQP